MTYYNSGHTPSSGRVENLACARPSRPARTPLEFSTGDIPDGANPLSPPLWYLLALAEEAGTVFFNAAPPQKIFINAPLFEGGMRVLVALVVVSLLLAACANNQLSGPYNPVTPPPPPQLTPPSPTTPASTNAVPPPTTPSPLRNPATHFLDTTRQYNERGVTHTPDGLVIGTEEDPFLIGDTLAEHVPLLGRGDLRILSAPQPVADGIPLHAESYVRFDFGENTSGELRFRRDPDSEKVRSELFFAEGKPLFEYAYLLKDTAFPLLLNQQLAFFGHTYVVKAASNTSVTLYGLDVAQWLVLQNNTALELNGTRLAHTRVFVDPWSVRIRYFADEGPDGDGLALLTGTSLRQLFPRPDAFLNPLFDLRYDGFGTGAESVITLSAGRRATLSFTDPLGERVTIHTHKEGTIVWGGIGERLHTRECDSLRDYCIALHEQFLLARPEFTSIMEFTGVNDAGNEANFKDLTTGEKHLVKLADTGLREEGLPVLDGAFRIDDATFPLRILLNGSASRASIDLDGDGGVRSENPLLLAENGVEVQLLENGTVELTLPELYGSASHQRLPEETLTFTLTPCADELCVSVGGVELQQQEEQDEWYGMSTRGVAVHLQESSDGNEGSGATLTYAPLFRTAHATIIG